MSSRVQLSISCKNLINMDVGSLSDPFVVVKTRGSRDAPWQEVARTEIIANNLNPQVRTALHCCCCASINCGTSFCRNLWNKLLTT
jgi:C2 domain